MYLGKFEIKSGKLHITDPCYTTDCWCGAYGLPALNGTWKARTKRAYYKEWGTRTKELYVIHEDFEGAYIEWEELPHTIGVDSGQCGIFDKAIYPTDEELEKDKDGYYLDKSHFYGRCCNITLKKKGEAGVVDNGGAVSSSGFGDGSYVAYAKKHNNKIVAIIVFFIVR